MTDTFGLTQLGTLEPLANSFHSDKNLKYWTSDLTFSGAPTVNTERERNWTFVWTRDITKMHPQVPIKFRIGLDDARLYRGLEHHDPDFSIAKTRGSVITCVANWFLSTGMQKSEFNVFNNQNVIEDFTRAFTIYKVDEYTYSSATFFHEDWDNKHTDFRAGGDGNGFGGGVTQATMNTNGKLPLPSEGKWLNKWIDIPHEPIMAGDQILMGFSVSVFCDGVDAPNDGPLEWAVALTPDINVKMDLITREKPMSSEARWWFTQRINQSRPAYNLFKIARVT